MKQPIKMIANCIASASVVFFAVRHNTTSDMALCVCGIICALVLFIYNDINDIKPNKS